MTTKLFLAAIFAVGVGLTSPAIAQVAQEGGPVMVGGDSWHADENALTQTWEGRVEVVQSNSRLRADHVVISHASGGEGENKGWGEVTRIEATGNVYYVTPENTVKGNTAVYTKSDDTMVISGDVVLKQGKNVMSGTRLVAAIGAGTTTMDAAPGSTNKGRVKAVLYPDEKQANQAAGN
ncbi:LptA/OstA family protein [Asticcacaulis sp. AC402]|uniref:LptA/OstA family protein n=1 Tax=Asticcacaulis sp. AC402 TaxID=1282361 RepID=UPI0003C3E5A6|nr:LptA/OstA family protein [Asticcacaulis sp. AC402]ESQ75839.1 hypothetical protein ABAC402_07690 [Asticcacaulis sp. AC402]